MDKPATPRTEKGYSTKYALTEGIEAVNVEPGTGDDRYVYVRNRYGMHLIRNNTFWETKEAAAVQARHMANRKIASLKKALAKMEVLAKTPKWK